MKKLFYMVMVLCMSVMTAAADNDQIIKYAELPQQSQAFLNEHFKGVEVIYAKKDIEMTVVTGYDVKLENGVEVEFDRKGLWDSVDVKKAAKAKMPAAIVPANILTYIKDYFKNARIVEIDRGTFGYEVSLDNGLDLEFDKNGEFKRIDD